ncbi:polysaccharide export outer membrane protein [Tistlia consotensis]|uniref:Polysaccharide export outer membrane protein n=1 Tax=Tistlia consotensis USBA 355 TaxID=560819 RepID=A0A1Y6BNL0_9PROT|nr:polysaccharide biosynthesis/export family protein [Tistlia consotensis]SMF21272.1 polysaccharide export outer membrane protein [Tistlia consotensis USBA 355]SNR47082.1 polysaccharide export outer membrane protein [Tistlia consotensis]
MVRLRLVLCAVLLALALLPGRGSAQSSGPAGAPQAVYRLDTGDKLRVTVFDEEDLSGEFEVNSTGVISLPLIGEVKAEGRTLSELEQAIVAKLLNGYLKNPRVSIEVLNYRPFYILGEVNNPGSYPYVSGMTVLNAVALAGGYTYRARKDRILIQRNGADKDSATVVGERAAVLPGDIITVDERFF